MNSSFIKKFFDKKKKLHKFFSFLLLELKFSIFNIIEKDY